MALGVHDVSTKTDDAVTRTYTPRSYWRFENASDFRQDSQGNQPLSSFEEIGAGEIKLWKPQSEGGIVGGYIDNTGEAINATKLDMGYCWYAHMGTVPLDSCEKKCKCNGTCTGTKSAPGLTIEMLVKPNPVCFSSVFTFFSTFPPELNHTAIARVSGTQYLFEAQTALGEGSPEAQPTQDWELEAPLTGVGVLAVDYLMDGNWHHFAFSKDAATGKQAIWIDGQSPAAMQLEGNISAAKGQVMEIGNLYFDSDSDSPFTCAGIDELALWEEALPPSLIGQHYKDAMAHNPYSTTDPGTPPPSPSLTAGQLDPDEFPPGAVLPTVRGNVTKGVSVSAIEQLQGFPSARYAAGHTLRENFNWMAPPYLGGAGQPGVSTTNVTTRSEAIQVELSSRWNYALVLDGHQCCSKMQNATIEYANKHPEVGLTVLIMRIQERPIPQLFNKTLPAGCYLQNAQGQNINCEGSISKSKVLRPTTPELAAAVSTLRHHPSVLVAGSRQDPS